TKYFTATEVAGRPPSNTARMSNTQTDEQRKAERRNGDRRVINIATTPDRRQGTDRRARERRAN
ncbi:MAG TPA: hypothetical protein VK702_05130, partial [Candidatus Acidoferrum sp.]|nr:hypothetical protein [Candidatus Acidoferrum sp.]